MKKNEKLFITIILFSLFIFVVIDLVSDQKEGLSSWHFLLEIGIGLLALLGLMTIFKSTFKLNAQLIQSHEHIERLKNESLEWKNKSQKWVEGLSLTIDQQLTQWHLTLAEKEVALLLLKGLSLKEIADIRHTSEKTTRAQSLSIYSKSGLNGRSELAAFFLEDLLSPQEKSEV